MRTGKTPAYRFHNARNCVVVTIHGKNHYLGEFGSRESHERYHRLIAEALATKELPPPPTADEAPLTLDELMVRYWRFAKDYYVKYGRPTSELDSIKSALRFVRKLYGSTPAKDFSPLKLKAVREAMLEHEIARTVNAVDAATGEVRKVRKVYHKGLARKCLNKTVGRIKRMFRWAVQEELVGVEVCGALLCVEGLKAGKTAARETPKVRPVAEADIAAVLPVVMPAVRAMIEVQKLCGGRPQDVVQLRAADIDRSGPVWEYRPPRYKTEHHGSDVHEDHERVLFLGPKAQAILAPLIVAGPDDYLFNPARSEAARNANRKERRLTPMTPSQAARKASIKRKKPFQQHYSVGSYRKAIRRACLKVGIPVWCPNRLRHSRLTEIRKLFSLEASRVVGGHREIGVTQIYAEQDQDLAREVMEKIG